LDPGALATRPLLPCRGGADCVSICEGLGLTLPTTTDDIGGGLGFGAPYRL